MVVEAIGRKRVDGPFRRSASSAKQVEFAKAVRGTFDGKPVEKSGRVAQFEHLRRRRANREITRADRHAVIELVVYTVREDARTVAEHRRYAGERCGQGRRCRRRGRRWAQRVADAARGGWRVLIADAAGQRVVAGVECVRCAVDSVQDLVGRCQRPELVTRLDVEVIDDDAEIVVRSKAFALPDYACIPRRCCCRPDLGIRHSD